MKTQWVVEVEKLKNPILKNSISRFNLWFSSIHFENYELVKKKKKMKIMIHPRRLFSSDSEKKKLFCSFWDQSCSFRKKIERVTSNQKVKNAYKVGGTCVTQRRKSATQKSRIKPIKIQNYQKFE